MYSEHAMVGSVLRLRVVVRRYELVVMLPPREDRAPMRQGVRHDRQPVAPSLHYCLHIMKRRRPIVQQTLFATVKKLSKLYRAFERRTAQTQKSVHIKDYRKLSCFQPLKTQTPTIVLYGLIHFVPKGSIIANKRSLAILLTVCICAASLSSMSCCAARSSGRCACATSRGRRRHSRRHCAAAASACLSTPDSCCSPPAHMHKYPRYKFTSHAKTHNVTHIL